MESLRAAVARESRRSASAGYRCGTTSTRPPSGDDPECLEAVATHAALAATRRGCGAARSCTPSATAIRRCWPTPSRRSTSSRGGRADIGLGAGWSEIEYDAYGIPFPRVEASAWTSSRRRSSACAGCSARSVTNFKGEWFQLHDAQCVPKPVQPDAADLDRWSRREAHVAHRRRMGRRLERPVRRPRRRSRTSARCCIVIATRSGATPLTSAPRSTSASRGPRRACASSSGASPTSCARACSDGSEQEVLDRIGEYVEAGVDQVNIALRAPFDSEGIERLARALDLC